jgi:nitrogen fixation NifU-like protein
MCGDRVQVWVKYGADRTIAETGFEARGCAISVASADLMAEAVAGLPLTEVRPVFEAFRTMAKTGICPECTRLDGLRPLAGVHEYPSRVKCATLPWHALVAALDGVKETQP